MRNLFYIAILFFSAGCVKEVIYIPSEKLEKAPVVHAYFSPDTLLACDVSYSRGILEDESFVKNADVNLYINHVLFQKLNYFDRTRYTGAANAMKANDSFYLQLG